MLPIAGDSREERSPAVGRGPVLEVHTEVVPANKRLEAGPDSRAAKVLAQLDRLVHGAVSIAEISGEGVAEMNSEALRRADG